MLGPLVANTLRAVTWPLIVARRTALVPRGAWVRLTLSGTLSEIERPLSRWPRPADVIRGGRASPPGTTIAAVGELFDEVARDPRVEGVLIRLEPLACGYAVIESLRQRIASLRAQGKRVAAWIPEGASAKEFLVAAACDHAYATPQAMIMPLGVASSMTFVKGLLSRGGIEAEVFSRREYKSAAEMFVRDGYSAPNREQITALLGHLYAAQRDAITQARPVSGEAVDAILDGGPYRGVDAKANGLLDDVAYEDELPEKLRREAEVRFVAAGAYLAQRRLERFRPLTRKKRVAVVEVRGAIVPFAQFTFGAVADARRITGAIRAAHEDPRVGAVVLYIDSRGGSGLASDLIAREVERLKVRKPVVALFSDVAASGGYYVGALAHEIVAQPTTVTGSIGVIAMRFQALGLLDKLGLTHDVIRRGERADLFSPYRAWSDGDRDWFDRQIGDFYNDFVGVVAKGRKREFDDVEALARGRVWAGADAQSRGLVDHLGGLDRAVARAVSLAGGALDAEPVVIPPPRNMPEVPKAPSSVQALVEMWRSATPYAPAELDLLTLAVNAPRETLFAWDPA